MLHTTFWYHVARAGKRTETKDRLDAINLYSQNDFSGFSFSYFGLPVMPEIETGST